MEKRRITIFRHAFCHFHSSGFHYRARNNRQDLIIGQFHLNLERVEEFRARISESARFNSKRGGGGGGIENFSRIYPMVEREREGVSNSKEPNVVIFRLNAHRNFGGANRRCVGFFPLSLSPPLE